MTTQRAFSINLGPSFTGLSLMAQPILPSGEANGSPITTGFVEVGLGNYLWTTTALPDNFVGGIRFSTVQGTLLAFIDVNAISPNAGTGAVQVDHNYGGPGALAYKTSAGVGIDGATVRVFLASNYSAGNTGPIYKVAETSTNINGEWVMPLMLDPATYTVQFFKQGEYGPDTINVTVTAM
jgi:hypothetical protein